MGRFIDLRHGVPGQPGSLTVAMGDVLRFAATGGRVREGTSVELLGSYVDSTVGTNGEVLTPAGTPNVVLFRSTAPGRSVIDVVTGDPWRAPETQQIRVTVAE
ncbi:hypothetical protein ACVCAH_13295 [Micromonospora sp. LZ34]